MELDGIDARKVTQNHQSHTPGPAPAGGWTAPPGFGEAENGLILRNFDDSHSPNDVSAFCTRWPPSRTPSTYCEWISIDRGTTLCAYPSQIESLQAAFRSVASNGNVSVDSLDQLACDHRILSGKWLIFTNPYRVDALWESVVKLVCLHRKSGCAKVTPNKGIGSYLICVYVEDYTSEDTMSLREDLRRIGVTWGIGFKMDAYTHLGIYAKNEFGIRPNRHYV
ncbi:translation initiation factor eIF 4e-like domain-containing protein [Mucidula mucida]|nr:translation initiation factor eIF 4e-like domain-containing protein [Mucidula mucida]